MAIANYPAWPFEPNWTSNVSDTREWLTRILTSPTGSEQRASIRRSPRRTLEFSTLLQGRARTMFDNLLATYGASLWHLPIWHDVNLMSADRPAGVNFLPMATGLTSALASGGVAFLVDEDALRYELVEIAGVDANGLYIVGTTTLPWPMGTRVYPTKISRLTDQPEVGKLTDNMARAQVRFMIAQRNPDPGTAAAPDDAISDVYRSAYVLTTRPNDAENLTAQFERMMRVLDNSVSQPEYRDTAARSFSVQKLAWVIEGRTEHRRFEKLFSFLRGRAVAFWMPTFMTDFDLAQPIVAGATTITVADCGFTLAGGPRPDFQDIMIDIGTSRIYRRIVDSAMGGLGTEVLVLDSPIQQNVAQMAIEAISFVKLTRLNQDSIEFNHVTDDQGISTLAVTVRSAPDTRVSLPAF